MKREEEREIAAKESTKGDDFQDACIGKAYFIIGAEWADKTMIDRACEWLRRSTILADTTIERFKQAMEE